MEQIRKLFLFIVILSLTSVANAFNALHLPNMDATYQEDDDDWSSVFDRRLNECNQSVRMLEFYLCDTVSFPNGQPLLHATIEMAKIAIGQCEYIARTGDYADDRYDSSIDQLSAINSLLIEAERAFKDENPMSFTEDGEALPQTSIAAIEYLKILIESIESTFSMDEDTEELYNNNSDYKEFIDYLYNAKLLIDREETDLRTLQQACHNLYASSNILILGFFEAFSFGLDVEYIYEIIEDENYPKGRDSIKVAVSEAEQALNDISLTYTDLQQAHEKFDAACRIFYDINEAYRDLIYQIGWAQWMLDKYTDQNISELAISELKSAMAFAQKVAEESESIEEIKDAESMLSAALDNFYAAIDSSELAKLQAEVKPSEKIHDLQGRTVRTPARNQIYVRNGMRFLIR